MRIDVLCSNPDHPVVPRLLNWIIERTDDHDIRLIHDNADLAEGDILFLVSCTQLIGRTDRARYGHVMVLHASDLPEGRGWSPHVWDILAGKTELTVSLLTAEDAVDTGAIWAKERFHVPRHCLYEEINDRLFDVELRLIDQGIMMVANGEVPVPQSGDIGRYHPRRTPEDSRIEIELPLVELFDRIRVADPHRFPAFFELHGKTYDIILKKR
jgi:methionyl-tRNA formyltransferase